jgi:hypothetical protein
MADVLKVLGQLSAAATTEEDLYTTPNLVQTTCSSITICNRTAARLSFRVSIAVDSAVTSDGGYLFYDAPIEANSSVSAVIGMTLFSNDTVRTYASSTGLSFNLFGVETS